MPFYVCYVIFRRARGRIFLLVNMINIFKILIGFLQQIVSRYILSEYFLSGYILSVADLLQSQISSRLRLHEDNLEMIHTSYYIHNGLRIITRVLTGVLTLHHSFNSYNTRLLLLKPMDTTQ